VGALSGSSCEDALHTELDAVTFARVLALAEARDALNDALTRLTDARLDRHFPGLAPALGLNRQHCHELPDRDGRCCAWMEPAPG
jgi:hypothetical protein